MSAATIPDAQRGASDEQTSVQKMLIENGQLIETIAEYQRLGRPADAMRYHELLHKNLLFLGNLVDPGFVNEIQNIRASAADPNAPPPAPTSQPPQSQPSQPPQHQQQAQHQFPPQPQVSYPGPAPTSMHQQPPMHHPSQYANQQPNHYPQHPHQQMQPPPHMMNPQGMHGHHQHPQYSYANGLPPQPPTSHHPGAPQHQ